jgi:hypothetical protein
MKSLVAGLENLLEEQLHLLHKINWQTFENVGDESTYVIEIGDKIKMFVPILRQMLSSLYFTNFCDKFAACFLPKILQTVMKCRKINQVATQQMLLDMYALKTLFLQLPLIVEGGIENTTTSSSNSTNTTSTSMIPAARYTKFVTQEMAKVESVLKLVGTPNEMLVESFKIMWPEGTSEDFQNIMSMKGLKKSEQGAFLDALGMQRKPTGKIAGMEEKMSDMTESLKKNMVNLTKVPFAFNSTS